MKTNNEPVSPAPVQVFSFQKQPRDDALKQIFQLVKTDTLRVSIQVIQKDFQENLHSHNGLDGFWLVLKGRIAFFGSNNEVLGEFGPMEGIFIPENNRYRYAVVGNENLEILQVINMPRGSGWDRKEHEPRHPTRGQISTASIGREVT